MFLTTGQRLKYYRIKIGLTQTNFCTGIMSKSMLSFIERDLNKLSKNAAEKFTLRINQYIQDIDERIEYNDLLKSKIHEIDDFYVNMCFIIGKTEVDRDTIIHWIDITHRIDDPRILLKFYYVIIATVQKRKICVDIDDLLDKSIKLCKHLNDYKFRNALILFYQRNFTLSNDFKEIITLYSSLFVEIYEKSYKIKIYGYIFYNFALSFQRELNYSKAIDLYKISEKIFYNQDALFNCLNNLGVCYLRKAEFEKALKSLHKLIKFNLSEHQKSIYYSNLLSCYVGVNNLDDALRIKTKLEKLLNNLPLDFQYQCFYSIGKVYLLTGDRYRCLKNYEKEINLPFNLKNNHFFLEKYEECIIALLNLYHKNDIIFFKRLEKYILRIPLKHRNYNFLIKVIQLYSCAYNSYDLSGFLYKLEK